MPAGMRGLAFQNISSWSFQLRDAHGGDYTILPFGNATIPSASGETFYITPLKQTQSLSINLPIQVSIAYLASAPASFSQTSQLPVYTLNAAVTVNSGTVAIDGTVELAPGTTVDATIDTSGGSVDVNVTGGDMNIGSLGSITETVNADTNVTNVKLSTNAMVYWGKQTVTVSNLASGSYQNIGDIINLSATGFYDGFLVLLSSTQGLNDYSTASVGGPSGGASPILFNNMEGLSSYLFNTIPVTSSPIQYAGGAGQGYQFYTLEEASIFSDISLSIYNTSSSTIASDTVTVSVYVIRANVSVQNSSNNPANVLQPATAYNPVTNGSITTGGTSQLMVGSNANRKFLTIWNTSPSDILWIQLGQNAGVNAGFPIGPGFAEKFDLPEPSNAIYIYGATTGDTYAYMEG